MHSSQLYYEHLQIFSSSHSFFSSFIVVGLLFVVWENSSALRWESPFLHTQRGFQGIVYSCLNIYEFFPFDFFSTDCFEVKLIDSVHTLCSLLFLILLDSIYLQSLYSPFWCYSGSEMIQIQSIPGQVPT